MSLDVTIGGTALPVPPASLKDLRTDKKLAFELAHQLGPYLDTTLESAPALGPTGVKYSSDAASWIPEGSAVTFGLQGGTACSLEIVNSGTLGTYSDGLEAPVQVDVPVPQGYSYVRLTMSFNLSANASAKYSSGAYGVKAALNAKDAYAITFCKAFLPTWKVRDAIAQTFASFVLPFRSQSLRDLQDGDSLWYEFDGNVGLCVGAYGGLEKAFYAGNGSADLLKLNSSPLATISASVQPEIKLAAEMDFKIDYASSFEAMLFKAGTSGGMHLCKRDKVTDAVSVDAGLTINVNAEVTLSQKVTGHLDELKTSLVRCAGADNKEASKAISAVTKLADNELNKYADEVTDKLQSWLNKADGHRCNLQAALEVTRAKTLLASYTFDLSDASFQAGWDFAMAGNLYGALGTGAVRLGTGSGLEREYQRKTSFQCCFFNLWQLKSWSDFSTDVSMVYAGNNVFHMQAKVGRSTGTDVVGSSRSMDLYFLADADAKAEHAISHVDLSLNVALNGCGDAKTVQTMARLLSAFDASDAMKALTRDLLVFNSNHGRRIVQLLVTIPSAAFANVQADANSGPHDEANWNRFAAAADALDAWDLSSNSGLGSATAKFLKQYGSWQQVNMAENGSSTADRNHFGAPGTFPGDWPTIQPGTPAAQLAKYSLWAGQHYMNFCAALQQLASLSSTDAVTGTWEGLLDLITKAVKQDVGGDFLRPAALATMQLCKGSAYTMTAPATSVPPVDHFSVAIRL